ncbi:MAG: glycosyltransferase family 1 protein [Thiothrix litoralis]|jgi:alpha-1,3-rhamnosyl/mannosyltransferase|uniref:glycosyltransferase family 4 protein n=1 Tax=Thiothrix litoralis TaxID=2891210 RepID=UPI003C73DB37
MGLKLLVDICPLLRRRTGVGNYIFYLLRELLQDDRVDDIVGVCGTRFWSRQELFGLLFLPASDTSSSLSGQQVSIDLLARMKSLLKRFPYIRDLRVVAQTVRLAYTGKRYKEYIFWGGNYYLPPFIKCKCLLTIHDLSHIHYPECHPVDRVRFLDKHLPTAIQRASAITVVSAATQEDVLKTFGDSLVLPPIFVVSPAVGEHFLNLDIAVEAQVRLKYALPEKFILSVGTFEPRKNLIRLLDAYAALAGTVRDEWPLLLVGEKGWLAEDIVGKISAADNVRWLGYVPEADMPYLYKLAGVFVYVSLFEGFGMPILEAMSVGTPVIASDRGSMREAAGNAARLVNPEKTEEISHALAEVITCTNIKDGLRISGAQRQQGQTWGARKDDMLKILQHIKT